MNVNDYQQQALAFANRTAMDTNARRLLNAALGLAGEAGECADLVKKWEFHGHDLDREKLKKELGDIAWYLALAATALDTDLSEILQGNLDKLTRRYPSGFSSEASINRKD